MALGSLSPRSWSARTARQHSLLNKWMNASFATSPNRSAKLSLGKISEPVASSQAADAGRAQYLDELKDYAVTHGRGERQIKASHHAKTPETPLLDMAKKCSSASRRIRQGKELRMKQYIGLDSHKSYSVLEMEEARTGGTRQLRLDQPRGSALVCERAVNRTLTQRYQSSKKKALYRPAASRR